MQELIKEIQELQVKKEELERQIEEIKNQMTDIETDIENKKSELIELMDADQTTMTEVDDLNASIFSKENVGYRNEAEVINWLKQNCQSDLVKTKITESIDKRGLNKLIKSNEEIAKELEEFTDKSITRWVVVTTKENHEKMFEHIKSGK